MSRLHVPTITPEDLQKFHADHFLRASVPANRHVNDEQGAYHEEEQSDLGYYDDGAKRTLTNEQIKIFRHSEIHTLLRERQRRREEEEDKSNEERKFSPTTVEKPTSTTAQKREDDDYVGNGDHADKSQHSNPRLPNESDQTTANVPQQPSFQELHTGRRIVSYAED